MTVSAGVPRVVLVDDHPGFRTALAAQLESLGTRVVAQASNGIEAIVCVRDLAAAGELPDAVVTDYAMSEMNGLTLSRALTAFWPQLLVVLVTGSGDEVILEAGKHAGATHAFMKHPDLGQRLAQVISGRVDSCEECLEALHPFGS